jgi:hypothetical protein
MEITGPLELDDKGVSESGPLLVAEGRYLAQVFSDHPRYKYWAKRIVACVNRYKDRPDPSIVPEMLEALKTAELLIALDIVRDDAGCLIKIREAIAKAKEAGF